ncbi:MAG: diguanylate cyclase domain-containing protein, partial [Thiohalophilus sp.]
MTAIDYLRDKLQRLLPLVGATSPNPAELDDNALISQDPLGRVADTFPATLAHQQANAEALRIAYAEIREVLNTVGAAIIVTDDSMRIEMYNERAKKLLLGDEQQVIGDIFFNRIKNCPYKTNQHKLKKLIEQGQRETHTEFVIENEYYDVTVTPIADQTGRASKIIFMFLNVTRQREEYNRQRLSAVVFESTSEGVVITDKDNRIVETNDALTHITGYQKEELLGRDPRIFRSGIHNREFYTGLWHSLEKRGVWRGEIWDRRKNGEIFPAWQTINTICNETGEVINYVSIFSDISAIKQSQEKLDFLAYHDPLTTLPNRVLFTDRLTQALEKSRRENNRLAIIFIDLDRFKNINDTLGHAFGDRLLVDAGLRLLNNVRKVDTVARLGGDEFIVLLEDIESDEHVA